MKKLQIELVKNKDVCYACLSLRLIIDQLVEAELKISLFASRNDILPIFMCADG